MRTLPARKSIFHLLLFSFGILLKTPCFSQAINHEKADTNTIKALNSKAFKHLATNTDSCIFYLGRSLVIAGNLHDTSRIMQQYNMLGSVYARISRSSDAILNFHSFFVLAVKKHNAKAISAASTNLGNIYVFQGKYSTAIGYHLMAIKLLEAMNNRAYAAISYYCIGAAYYELGNYGLSLSYYQKALEIAISTDDKNSQVNCYIAIGTSLKSLKQYNAALATFNKASGLIKIIPGTGVEGYNLSAIGETYTLLNQPEKALPYLMQALAIFEKSQDVKASAETNLYLGNAWLALNNNEKALKYLSETYRTAKQIGAEKVLLDYYKGIIQLNKKEGKLALALGFNEKYNQLKDSLFTANSSRQIAEMQTKYETEKKQRAISMLEKQEAEKDLEVSKQKNLKNISFAVLAALLIIGFLAYSNYKRKQEVELQMQELKAQKALFNERNRISRELHDNIGSQLTYIISNLEMADIYLEKSAPGKVKDVLNALGSHTRTTMQQLRESIWTMNKEVVELTELGNRVQNYLQKFFSESDTQLSINWPLTFGINLQPLQSLNLFRVIQEIANNTVKYAKADIFELKTECINNIVYININDNGKGFAINEVKMGHGLNNIRHRISEAGGTIEIASEKGEGTTVTISIPVKNG